MEWWQAILIAIIEGITEFLPVSSTGHMIIAERILNVPPGEFVKAFTVIIQFGAIVSVVVLYWKRFFHVHACKIFEKKETVDKSFTEKLKIYVTRFLYKYDFYWKLFVAFLPAAALGFLFSEKIDLLLESVTVVAVMLVLGGIFMLFVDKLFAKTTENQKVGWQKALIIGFCQCVAMIPGVSRSMATIVGGMSQKLTRKNAAEFSFFLAVPTMAAASGYKLLKLLTNDESRELLLNNINVLIIGNIVAFIVAMLAIKFFIEFLTKYGFKAFGYYRIAIGLLLLVLLA
jgi:undecaprenyl-diphosphatase